MFPFFKPKHDFSRNTIAPVALIVLDGWGVAPDNPGNAISQARLPFWQSLLQQFPNGTLIASGESVGLPANEVGNTEVGHLTIGAGRVVLQDVKRIGNSIEDGSFFDNSAFLKAITHAKQNNSTLHLLGLVSSGNVHASKEHLFALLQLCMRMSAGNVCVDMITDGRDSPPQEAATMIVELEQELQRLHTGRIGTVMGRYFVMDRDRRWERTEAAYRALVEGTGATAPSAAAAIAASYQRQLTDEFIPPTTIVDASGKPVGLIRDNDAVIFFNFRVDRPRQLTMALTIPDFERLRSFVFGYSPEIKHVEGEVTFSKPFERRVIVKNLCMVTMTNYQRNIPVTAVAFDEQPLQNSLTQVVSLHNLRQLHMAESEKERFVTYYFDGLHEGALPGEKIIITPSPRVPTYDKKPAMAAKEQTKTLLKELATDQYHFIVINFANPDMVAHSGNLKATIKACEVVDTCLRDIVEAVLQCRGAVVVTADHGNAEELLTYRKSSFFFTSGLGRRNTDHSNSPVPLVMIKQELRGRKVPIQGSLSDIAPTVLGLLGIPKPDEMTGRNLLAQQVGNF